MKKVKVFLFLAVFAFAFLLLGANVKTNAASTTLATSDKIVVKGASVRLTDPSGLRFVGTTDGYVAPEGKNVVKYGIALAYGKQVVSDEFVINGKVDGLDVINGEVDQLDEKNQYYVALIGIPTTQYDTYFTARAYVVLDDNTVVYGAAVAPRALSEVVAAARRNGEQGEFIDKVAVEATTTFNFDEKSKLEKNYTVVATKYNNSKWDGDHITLSTVNGGGYANSWYRLGIKADTKHNGLYRVAVLGDGGAADVDFTGCDYVIAAHDKAIDRVSFNIIKKLATDSNAKNLFIKITGTIPEKAGLCDIKIDFDINNDYVINNNVFGVGEKLPTAFKEFYTFKGWCAKQDLSDTPVNVQGTDRTLYAKFVPTEYKINLVLNDGVKGSSFNVPTTYNYESAEIVLPTAADLTKEGFTFGGWYSDTAFTTEKVLTIPAKSHGSKTYYAKWIADAPIEVALTAADKAAIAKITADKGTPTIVINHKFTGGKIKCEFGEYTCGTNAFPTLNAAFINGKVTDNSIIYVFADTYTDDVKINKACLIAGPNYGIKGNEIRNDETIFNANVEVTASNVTLNGIKFIGSKAIKIMASISNLSILNCYDEQLGVQTNGGRTGLITMEDTCTLRTFNFSNNKVVAKGGAGRNLIAFYGDTSDMTFENNDITNGGTFAGNSECIRIKRTRGIFNIKNNNIVWSGAYFTFHFAEGGNNLKTLNIIDNTIGGGTAAASGFFVRYMDPNTHTNFIGNKFKNISGNTFQFFLFPAGSNVHIMYNIFDENTSYKVSDPGKATIEFVDNLYLAAQKTATPDYGKIKTVEDLNAAYEAYKAKQGK